MKKMTGLIFDLDGVITDTAVFHYQAWKQLGAGIGVEIDEAFNEQLKGVSRIDSLKRILAYGNKEDAFTQEEIDKMLQEKNEHYLELLEQLTPNDILPGVVKLLDGAKANNFKISLASASMNAPMILEKLGIAHYFDAIVDPATLTNGKPDPEIFVKAAEMINVPIGEAIGFEDAQTGVDGLKEAGIFTVGLSENGLLEGADVQLTTLEDFELNDYLGK